MFSPSRFLVLILVLFGGVALAAEPKLDRFGDPLPDGAIARLGSMRLRSIDFAVNAAFSVDGKSLIVLEMHSLSFWDPATGKVVRRVPLPEPPRLHLVRGRLTADGKTAIRCGEDSSLRFVDTSSGAERSTIRFPPRDFPEALEVSRDGKILATVHRASFALWNVPEGKLLREFKGPSLAPPSPYHRFALSADGKRLLLPHKDGSLHLVDTASGKELRAFETPQAGIERVVLSPDGRYLAYRPFGEPITVRDLATGQRVSQLVSLRSGAQAMSFTPNSRFLAVEDAWSIRLFGVLSGKEIRNLPLPRGASTTLAFSPDGRLLATLPGGFSIHLWDLIADRIQKPEASHEGSVRALAFFPDGKRLASTDEHGNKIVWDVDSGRALAELRNNSPHFSLQVAEDGESVRFAAYGPMVFRWDPRTGRQESWPVLFGRSANRLALSPDGRSLAILNGGIKPKLHLLNLKDSKASVELALPERETVTSLLFTQDSRRLAAASSDGMLRLWDRGTGKLVREISDAPGRYPQHLTLAGDGRSLALFDGPLRIREIASGGERLCVPLKNSLISLAYSPDARWLACGLGDDRVSVYSAVNGKRVAHWDGGQGAVGSLAFSRDGRLLASGGSNGIIVIWELPESDGLPATLSADEASALWGKLADEDADLASSALTGLAAAPEQAVPLIRERFSVIGKPPSPERLADLIAQLDDDSFKVRERATRELAEAGPDAADALRRALANDPTVETKGRIEQLLARLSKGGDPERLRSVRAIEVLERIGTPQAKDVLRGLLVKSLSHSLAEEVRASLQRLGERR